MFSPAGRGVMIIVPYYFEFMMPSELMWTPLLVMDFWGGK